MISASDFRNGITIEKDGNVLEIVEFQHVKPGKGAAFVRTKLRDVINGGVTGRDIIGDKMKFVKENDMVKLMSYNGNVFSIEPPMFVELEITETEPGFKGNTATGATKPATVETGATVNVPLFCNIGDVIKIDTRSGEYLSRA